MSQQASKNASEGLAGIPTPTRAPQAAQAPQASPQAASGTPPTTLAPVKPLDDNWQMLYGPVTGDRFAGVPLGVELMQLVFKYYHANSGKKVFIPFFDSSGNRNLVPHACNRRGQTSVVRSYVKSILKYGFLQSVRGDAWAQEGAAGAGSPVGLMSCGQVCEAIYTCAKDHADNRHVKETILRGMEVDVFQSSMPSDVVTLLKDLHNAFHGGSETSFVQVLSIVLEADAKWKVHAFDAGIDAKGNSKYATWFPSVFALLKMLPHQQVWPLPPLGTFVIRYISNKPQPPASLASAASGHFCNKYKY